MIDTTKIWRGLQIAIVLMVVAAFAYLIYQNNELKKQQQQLQTAVVQMKVLSDGTVRSQQDMVSTKDLQAFMAHYGDDVGEIKADLAKMNASIDSAQHIEVVTPGYHGTSLSSSSTEKTQPSTSPIATLPCENGVCPNLDPYGYQKETQVLRLNEPFPGSVIVPFGSTKFDASQKTPWTLTVNPRTYSVDTVTGIDDNGRQYAYNKFKIKSDGKEYIVPIQSKLAQHQLEAKFRFSPRFYLGMLVGASVGNATGKPTAEASPSLQVSLLSYGKQPLAPTLTFLDLGIGVGLASHRPMMNLSPITYNIGANIPLMTNLAVGPGVGISTNGDVVIYVLGIHAGL